MSTASWWGQRTTLQLKIQRHVNQNHGIQPGYYQLVQIHIYFNSLHTQYELTPPMAGVKATLSALPPAGLGETETVL